LEQFQIVKIIANEAGASGQAFPRGARERELKGNVEAEKRRKKLSPVPPFSFSPFLLFLVSL
jgi:hypothetical protein